MKQNSRGVVLLIPLLTVSLILLAGIGFLVYQNSQQAQQHTNLQPTGINKHSSISPTYTPASNTSQIKIGKSFEIKTKDKYALSSAKIEKDALRLNISYSGGCKEHVFEIIWNGFFLESNPPQVDLFLVHNANGDRCEAYITKKDLQFDLSPIKRGALDQYQTEELIINIYDFENTKHRQLIYKLI